MDVLEAIKSRRSIRKFRKESLPPKTVREILEAGRWAPSARNSQPWRFIVIRDEELKRRIAEATSAGKFLADASIGVAVVVNPKATRHPVEDGANATMNMLLAAHSMGLGACWIGSYGSPYEEEVKQLLEVPRDWLLISIIALGYPAEKPESSRIELKELVYVDRFGSKERLEEVAGFNA
ncbi:MAG: nitroreductase family protein [Candidatus Nezhaarchaeota archaeon]|nr:nitroreductase family protein [Candidatus Nezhaarchaeota archaeon]